MNNPEFIWAAQFHWYLNDDFWFVYLKALATNDRLEALYFIYRPEVREEVQRFTFWSTVQVCKEMQEVTGGAYKPPWMTWMRGRPPYGWTDVIGPESIRAVQRQVSVAVVKPGGLFPPPPDFNMRLFAIFLDLWREHDIEITGSLDPYNIMAKTFWPDPLPDDPFAPTSPTFFHEPSGWSEKNWYAPMDEFSEKEYFSEKRFG